MTPVDEPRPTPRPPTAGLPQRLLRLAAAAALSGVLLYVSFPPRPLWWLALPGLRAARLGPARPQAGGRPSASATCSASASCCRCWSGPAWRSARCPWLALAAVEALFVALVGVGHRRRVPAARLAGVGGRGLDRWARRSRARVPFGGFPWGKIAFGQADGVFLPLAALGGTPLLCFAVVLCGFGLYEAVRRFVTYRRTGEVPPRRRRRSRRSASPSPSWPRPRRAARWSSDTAEDGTATVAVIQGNVPRLGLDFNAQRRAVLDNHAKRTTELADEVKAGKVAAARLRALAGELLRHRPVRQPRRPRRSSTTRSRPSAPPSSVGAVRRDGHRQPPQHPDPVGPGQGPRRHLRQAADPAVRRVPAAALGRRASSATDVDRVQRDFGPGTKAGVFDHGRHQGRHRHLLRGRLRRRRPRHRHPRRAR